jgi:2'-5' RNA ligase
MTRDQRARLFSALELPGEVTAELVAWARAALPQERCGRSGDRAARGRRREVGADPASPGVRLLGAELMHVTLCFLGARPVAEIDALARALLASEPPPHLSLALGTPVWLPPRRPRALAVEVVDEDGGLRELQARISDVLAAASTWQPERRRYRAHVTVARMRSHGGARAGGPAPPAGAHALPATPAVRFTPAAIALYRSWLAPSGASYEPLAAVDLPGW